MLALIDVVRAGGHIVITGLVEGPDTRGQRAILMLLGEQEQAGIVTGVRDFVVSPDGAKPVRVLMATLGDLTTPKAPTALSDSEQEEENVLATPATNEPLTHYKLVGTSGGSGAVSGVADGRPLTLQSPAARSRMRNAVVYAIICPTDGGGVVYVGATICWETRLHEHVTGKGSAHLYRLVKHLDAPAARKAFLQTHILFDLAERTSPTYRRSSTRCSAPPRRGTTTPSMRCPSCYITTRQTPSTTSSSNSATSRV